MSALAQFPAGNAFSFPIALSYTSGGTSTPVSNLADALDIVIYIGPDPSAPELGIDLASGKISVDSPSTGSLTVSVLSTDTIDMTVGKPQYMSVQVKYALDETNNVEWPKVRVFTLQENVIPPAV